MPFVRAGGVVLCAATALAGCTTQLAAAPPAGVSLAGNWKVDPGASDDPQKALAKMREEAYKIIARRQSAPPPLPPPGARGKAGGSAAESPPEEDLPPPPPPGAQRPDPLRRSPMAHVILDFIARGDFLTVRQAPGQFVLDYGITVRTFTPGAHSVVSAEGGVGDQTSGWKGHSYLIQVKAQSGPDVTEEFSVAADGKELLDKLHIGSAELPAVTLTRVYRPSDEVAPRLTPNND
jgi:hypothetical protein